MFKQIELAIESEEYSKAEDLLQELIKSEADSLWLRYYQALIKEKQENFIDAERDYRQVIKDSIYNFFCFFFFVFFQCVVWSCFFNLGSGLLRFAGFGFDSY